MILKRKIYQKLKDWKANKSHECLVVKGARQTGKTFLIRLFGEKEYESFIEINFHKQAALKVIFEGDKSAEEIYKRMSANISGIKLIPGKTLIFLDEIQKCSAARTALKFLAEDNRYDVIASGSLLGLSYGEDADKEVEQVESIPVGYEKSVMMYSLDFEEFLWAYGFDENALAYLKEFYLSHNAIPSDIHGKYEALVKEFLVVGGMPEAVDDFMQHKDFTRVQGIQNKILDSYIDDIGQHVKKTMQPKVRKCYHNIPSQLAKENKKFQYSLVESRGGARKFATSIQWLIDANMVHPCFNVSLPELPLNAYEKDNEFKLYMNDTGLLLSLYGFETKRALLNNTLHGSAKGGIYENFIAETLIKKGYSLHYYRPNEECELEFVIEKDGNVIPIEVKAGNTVTKSLNLFIEKFKPEIAYKLISGNLGMKDNKYSIPHFMAMFL